METADLAVDPDLVAHTAGRVLDAALGLGDRARALVGDVAVSGYAFGVLGGRINREFDAGLADVQATVDRLCAQLQGDADKLYRTAFAAQDAHLRAVGLASAAIGDAG